jgi:SnoaL-like domain
MVACFTLKRSAKEYFSLVDYGEKLRLLRASNDAFNRRDLEQLLELYHPECEWNMSNYSVWPEDRVYRGHSGLEKFFTAWLDPWTDFRAGFTDAVDLPDLRLFVVVRGDAQGRLSQAPVEIPPFAQIIEFLDGTLLRVDNYSGIETARKAVGI